MSIALAYASDLSRVQITGVAPGVKATFGTPATDSWSAADTGQTWTNSGGAGAGDFDVASGEGTHSNGTVNSFRQSLLSYSAVDLELSVEVKSSAVASGADQIAEVFARYIDTNNFYRARLAFAPGGAVTLSIRRRLVGNELTLGTITTGITHTANTKIAMRFRVVGTFLRAKAWLASTTEPTDWMLTETDPSIFGTGQVGLRSVLSSGNTNTLPVVFSFDNFTSRGTAVVERSTDQITWAAVRGGASLDGSALVAYQVDDYEFEPNVLNYYRVRVQEFSDTASITPNLTSVWVKNIAKPYLNRAVTVTDWSDVERRSRVGMFPIVGRTLPVAVTDRHLSRQYQLVVTTANPADAEQMDLCFAAGDPVLIHVPPNCPVPGMYAVIGDVTISRRQPKSARRYLELPLTEVAAPGPDIIGATNTWQNVINTYATWADVIAANATWQDLLNGISDPADVIVP